jgi:Periplasmic sensor domain
MKLILDMHFRSQAALIIIGTTAFCTSFAALIIMFANINFAKDQLLAETTSFAEILGVNMAVPLAFGDKTYANEILNSVKLHKSIARICVYKKDKTLFTEGGSSNGIICPQNSLGSTSANELIINVPVLQNEVNLGSMSMYVSDERVEDFRHHIFLPSLGIIIGFTLFIAVPLSALVQRRISKPVNQLVSNAQSLVPNQHNDPNDLYVALKVVALAKQQLLEFKNAAKWDAYKTKSLVKNYKLSFTLIKDQITSNSALAETNESLVRHSQLPQALAAELFALASSESRRAQENLQRLEHMLGFHQLYLASYPTRQRIDDIIRESYEHYFGKFRSHKIVLEIGLIIDTPINFFPDAFKAFIISYFAFCDQITQSDITATIKFMCGHPSEMVEKINCTLLLTSEDPIISILPNSTSQSNRSEEDISSLEFEDKVKSSIESLIFFANLNSRSESAVSMRISERRLLVNFNIDEQ